MRRRFRILLVIVVAVLIVVHVNGVAHAYGSPLEDWTLGTVNKTGCANKAFRFNSAFHNLNTGPGYTPWIVVADTDHQTPTSRIWMAYAPSIAFAVPPFGGASVPFFVEINNTPNAFGGLQWNTPFDMPSNIPLFIEIAMVRFEYPYLIQTARVYSFHCNDPIGSTPSPVWSCQDVTCGGVGRSSALGPASYGGNIPFPFTR